MRISAGVAAVLVTTLASPFRFANAQLVSSCNPTINQSCPDDPTLGTTFAWDFRNGPNSAFTTDSYWRPYITYDAEDGATFILPKQGVVPTLGTTFYVMYGRIEVTLKKATGTGIITDCIFQSDDLDEIDLEWTSWSDSQVQSKYFSIKNGQSFAQSSTYTSSSSLSADFHMYGMDWNVDRMLFTLDGSNIRTVSPTNNNQYPQTPMRVTMGIWADGDANNTPGTRYWAGGDTDYSEGPFSMIVQAIKITDYSTGSAYHYGDQSGNWNSIKAINGSVNAHATAAANSNTISAYTVPASLVRSSSSATSSATQITVAPTVWPLPLSPNGHCGASANYSTGAGSLFGNCCSSYGFCGSGPDFCGDGCQQ